MSACRYVAVHVRHTWTPFGQAVGCTSLYRCTATGCSSGSTSGATRGAATITHAGPSTASSCFIRAAGSMVQLHTTSFAHNWRRWTLQTLVCCRWPSAGKGKTPAEGTHEAQGKVARRNGARYAEVCYIHGTFVHFSTHMPCSTADVSRQAAASAETCRTTLLFRQRLLSALQSASRSCICLVAKLKLDEPASARQDAHSKGAQLAGN